MTQIDGGLDAQQTGDDSAHSAAIRAISHHVMDRYRAPLCAYVRGSRWKSFGDADDLSLDSLRVDLIRLHIFSGGKMSAFHSVAG